MTKLSTQFISIFLLANFTFAWADSRPVDTVKHLPCTQGGTVEDCFIKKTAIPAVKDLGWSTKQVENGYLIERTIQINGLKSPTIYRWQVDSNGTATPANGHAIGITKK